MPEFPVKDGFKLPYDLSEVPDIFVNFYTNDGEEIERFAYLRLKASECATLKPNAHWFRLTTPYNDTGTKNVGMVMMSLRLVRYEMGAENRRVVTKSEKSVFKFYCQIIQGFEIASCVPNEGLKVFGADGPRDLETQVSVAIGNLTVDQGGLKTDTGYSWYPVWNYCKSVDVKLVVELMFETDMRVSLRPAKESNVQEIGSFVVPVHSIARYPHRNSKRPQFFHLLNEEGQFVGSILCNFYVKLYPKMS